MKKIFSFAIVLAAVAMVGCCGNATKPAEAAVVEATEVVEATVVVDSTACCAADSTACTKVAEGECCKK